MKSNANDEHLSKEMMLAWGRVKRTETRLLTEWWIIGEGFLAGRRWAMRQAGTNKPEGKGYCLAYAEWLKRWQVQDIHKTVRGHLLQLMDERPAVEEYVASLPIAERRRLNHPTTIWRKWRASQRPKPTKKPSGAREGRANEQLQARIKELEEELRGQTQETITVVVALQEKEPTAQLGNTKEQLERAKQLIAGLQERNRELQEALDTAQSRIKDLEKERSQSIKENLDDWHTVLAPSH